MAVPRTTGFLSISVDTKRVENLLNNEIREIKRISKLVPKKIASIYAETYLEEMDKARGIGGGRPRIEKWTNDMAASAEECVKKNLIFMDLPNVQFNTTISNNHLTFYFDTPVISDSAKEKILFRSFAHLIMISLKNKFKTDFKYLKVVLTRA